MNAWVGVAPVIGTGSLDGFAFGALMSGACVLAITAPGRARGRLVWLAPEGGGPADRLSGRLRARIKTADVTRNGTPAADPATFETEADPVRLTPGSDATTFAIEADAAMFGTEADAATFGTEVSAETPGTQAAEDAGNEAEDAGTETVAAGVAMAESAAAGPGNGAPGAGSERMARPDEIGGDLAGGRDRRPSPTGRHRVGDRIPRRAPRSSSSPDEPDNASPDRTSQHGASQHAGDRDLAFPDDMWADEALGNSRRSNVPRLPRHAAPPASFVRRIANLRRVPGLLVPSALVGGAHS